MKGELITGNVLDIILIIFVLAIIVIVLNLTGVSINDVLSLASEILSSIWDWFYGIII